MIHLVTGAAGFVGHHLVDSLLGRGHQVIAVDNFSRGQRAHLALAVATGRCHVIKVDCADGEIFLGAVRAGLAGRPAAALWHLAANSDIPAGVADPRVDLRDTFMTTFTALDVMRALKIPTFHFASSSAIYGDFGTTEIAENTAPYRPISNYGAMKLASEAAISAALEVHGQRASIFRFPNVVGAPLTHGVIYDFVRKLAADQTCLPVLGDGTQQKSYLHVSDLIEAMHLIAERAPEKVAIYNIGPLDDGVTVRFIAEHVRDSVSPTARITYGQGGRGWVGDIPRFRYNVSRLTALGWRPRLGSEAAVRQAVADILAGCVPA